MDGEALNRQGEGFPRNTQETKAGKRGLSGSTLKLIAITAMLIDHIGAVVLGRYLYAAGFMDIAMGGDVNAMVSWLEQYGGLYQTYSVMRMIGRIAFPIFCFLLIEGFQRTRNKWKYAQRLGIFVLVSEIPFDLALRGKPFDLSYQNVFFTLFFGLVVMASFEGIGKRQWVKQTGINAAIRFLLCLGVLVSFCVIAVVINSDYNAVGVISIIILYLFRKSKPLMITAGCFTFLWELTAPLAFLPIGFYNGKRGLKLKYVFYLFYPLHLLVLYVVCVCLGTAAYPAV